MKDYIMMVLFAVVFGGNCFYTEHLRITGELEKLSLVMCIEAAIFIIVLLVGHIITIEKEI